MSGVCTPSGEQTPRLCNSAANYRPHWAGLLAVNLVLKSRGGYCRGAAGALVCSGWLEPLSSAHRCHCAARWPLRMAHGCMRSVSSGGRHGVTGGGRATLFRCGKQQGRAKPFATPTKKRHYREVPRDF